MKAPLVFSYSQRYVPPPSQTVPAYNCAGKCTGNLFGKRRCIAQNAFWPFLKKIMVSPLHLYTPSRPSCLFKHINFYGFPAGVLLYQRHLGEIIIEKPFFCVINLLSKWVLSLGILGKLNYTPYGHFLMDRVLLHFMLLPPYTNRLRISICRRNPIFSRLQTLPIFK